MALMTRTERHSQKLRTSRRDGLSIAQSCSKTKIKMKRKHQAMNIEQQNFLNDVKVAS